MPLTPGTRLGTYEILALLGKGGMGEVHRARDTRLKRDVAIKVLPADVASSPDRIARFEREATMVAGLNHPNIVTLHSVEDVDGTRFLTMELVEGRNLADLVTSAGMPLTQLLDLAIPLADALVSAHEKGVVHRDLKPTNVMVTRDGRVKVLDFGLAKLVQSDSHLGDTLAATQSLGLSVAGEVVGTAPYMAPEQIRGDAVDARTDLFSFGVLLYELTCGMRPFAGNRFADVSSAILRDPPPPLSGLRADVPADLERIIERCLAKHPRERFQTALDVLNELRGLRRALESVASLPPRDSSERAVSIAVLPFVNRSANADDEYFSDGLADELLNLLSKIQGLRVLARASSFYFKGQSVPLSEIGRTLNVATIIDGTVRRAGPRVRISVQLVRVADGSHLWSETYDRMLEDIFAVQDDIAQSVVKELRTTLLGERPGSDAMNRARAEVDRAAKGRSTDPEAHRLYLLARHLMDGLNREATAQALVYLKQAVERDPGFALAWVELSVAHSRELGWAWVTEEVGGGRARKAVERALELEPDLAEGHAQLAAVQIVAEWDWPGAQASLARARELAPSNPNVLRLCGLLANAQGHPDEAAHLFRQALEQDPLSAAAYHSLGVAQDALGDPAGAEESLRKALELGPQRIASRALLAMTVLSQGRIEDALAVALREPENGLRLGALALIHHARHDSVQATDALQRLIDNHAENCSLQVAEVHAATGDVESAFAWLDRAYQTRDPGLARVRVNPRLRSLHSDPRWRALLAKLGFERS